MEITLNTKRIDYQTAVEILNSNNPGTYTICGPNLISKTEVETTTLYTYAGIKIDDTLYSEYEITPENYNYFNNNVKKDDKNNIKFYLIPQITKDGDKSYTLTTNEEIKNSITLCTCTTNSKGITTSDLTATIDNTTPSAGDIYYNIKTYSHTTTNPNQEVNIQSQHQIYDNITSAYSNITCVIDYKKFIQESSTNSHLGCVNLKAIAPNIFCNTSSITDIGNNCIFSYLGQADVMTNTNTTIYNHRSVPCSQYSTIISDKPFLILKPLEFFSGTDCIYICPIKIYCFKYESDKKTTLCDYTCKLQNLNIKIRGPKQFDSNNICYCEAEKHYSYIGSEGNGIFPIHISDYCTKCTPTDTNPWEFYYIIQTANGPVESPHSLIWRDSKTDEDNNKTYSIGCKSYY